MVLDVIQDITMKFWPLYVFSLKGSFGTDCGRGHFDILNKTRGITFLEDPEDESVSVVLAVNHHRICGNIEPEESYY